jgi:predicted permease
MSADDTPKWHRYLRFWRPNVAADVDAELTFHVDARTQELCDAGLEPGAARAQALREFGDLDRARSALRSLDERYAAMERRGLPTVNLKLAFRALFKTPLVTSIAVLSLALGIGANAAIFSLFHEVLLAPLPVPHPEQLVNVLAEGPNPPYQSCNQAGSCDVVFSYPMFKDLERAHREFSGIAGHELVSGNIAYRGQTRSSDVMLVSGSYFSVLGLRPAIGRLIAPQDDETVGADFSVVLGYGYWQAQLGGDTSVVGTKIMVNGQTFTIIGVAPEGFNGTTLGTVPALYVPLTMKAALGLASADEYPFRRIYWIYAFARLKPGATIQTATTAVNAVYHRIISEVEVPLQKDMSAQTMAKFKAKEITLEDGRRGQSVLQGQARMPLLILFATAGIVLLIACANIANLLLVRGAGRSLEVAVRMTLGATRKQLVAQLVGESLLLGVMGGALSLLVARLTLGIFTGFVAPGAADAFSAHLSGPALGFAAALSIGTGLLFGMFPAIHSTRPDLVTLVREGTGTHSGARTASRVRTALVTTQIALSMALLVMAGLFTKSLRNVSRVNLGVNVQNVVMFSVSPGLNGYNWRRSRALFEGVDQDLSALPGVTGVGESVIPLLGSSNRGRGIEVQGFSKGPDTDDHASYDRVSPGFFRTMGIPILSGRDIAPGDRMGSQKVAVVNETFAKKFGLGSDAVGKFMADRSGQPTDILIVGLAKDAKYSELKGAIPPVFYLAAAQDSTEGSMYYYVRASGDPEPVLRAVRSIVARRDPNLPVDKLKTLPQQVSDNVYLDRMIGELSAGFAVLATLLAAIGLYGVLAYSIAQRTREFGVRIALGADPVRVRLMVLRQVALMTLIGGLAGIAGAIALGKPVQSLLFEINGFDPLVVALSALLLVLVALGAGYIPARRASRLDPVRALRYD